MSDTPETDHLEVQLAQAAMHSHPILWEHSRRMERERDEAIHGSCVNYNFTQDARRERDEAREKAERYRMEANALMMQRDELLERNAKLRDIADRALMLNQSQ
jgi:outer membrane usher protein FimD/PapC